jgi:parallel beta-helix repeat protein
MKWLPVIPHIACTRKSWLKAAAVFGLVVCVLPAARSLPESRTFVVTHAEDEGDGSLRQAILDANAHSGTDRIVFNIEGEALTISPMEPLPDITEAVEIDGTTQPGYEDRPRIEIEGSLLVASDISGLSLTASDCTVRGLAFTRFGAGGVLVSGASNVTIEKCHFGVDPGGAFALGNAHGIIFHDTVNSRVRHCVISGNGIGVLLEAASRNCVVERCLIGTDHSGTAPVGNFYGILADGCDNNTLDANIISGNRITGIVLSDSTGISIQFNIVGLDIALLPLPNEMDGIDLQNASDNRIADNLIACNGTAGVLLQGTGTLRNRLQGNSLMACGTGIEITRGAVENLVGGIQAEQRNLLLGNYFAGVVIDGVASQRNRIEYNDVQSNLVYGIAVGGSNNAIVGNVITENALHGVWVGKTTSSLFPDRVSILSNVLYSNGDLGIWLDSAGGQGANHLQSAPTLLNAGTNEAVTAVQGALSGGANQTYRLQFYANFLPDDSGFGEGEWLLGEAEATTNAQGIALINANFPLVDRGMYLTATATAPDGSTSEFSNAVLVGVANPSPAIAEVSPASVLRGSSALTLIISGENFLSDSVVLWNNAPRSTTFVSDTRLTIAVTADELTDAREVQISVANPPPGGGISNSAPFQVTNPAPALTGISPDAAIAGDPAFILTVEGTGFVPESVVRWNGEDRATTFVSETRLTASISAADIAASGTQDVTVFTPGPGGGTSAALSFLVSNRQPGILSLSPATVLRGSPALTLAVQGTNFIPASKVRWNGAERVTQYVSPTELRIAVPANSLTQAAEIAITVVNPEPGGGISEPRTFTVANPLPTLAALSPAGVTAGASSLTVMVTGSGFVPESRVHLNGAGHLTIYSSPTTLQLRLGRRELERPGDLSVTVVNPAPGGGTSAARTFAIGGTPQLALQSATATRTAGGAVSVNFTLKNIGTLQATRLKISAARLGGIASNNVPALPINLPDIAPNAISAPISLMFPSSVPAGAQVLTITVLSGTERSLTTSRRITVP